MANCVDVCGHCAGANRFPYCPSLVGWHWWVGDKGQHRQCGSRGGDGDERSGRNAPVAQRACLPAFYYRLF